jgi:type IV pilus assembly protein PilC
VTDFVYKAIDRNGTEKKGNIQAESLEAAYGKLKSEGLTPIDVTKANLFNKELDLSFGGGVKPRDLSVFCRQLVSMLDAGVTIIDSVAMLEEQTENKTLKKALGGVKVEIGKGETLSTAMAKYPNAFPDIMVKMVAAGEASGKMEVAFERMSEHFEKSAHLNGLVKKAAVYPIVVAIVAVVVVIVMLVKVVPSFTDMFADMDMELPKITLMVVAASHFLQQKWFWIIVFVIAVVAAVRVFKQTEQGKVFFATISRKAPIFGTLTVKSAASNFSRTLSTLICSGLSMVEALGIVADTMSNYLYKKKVQAMKEEVVKGVPLSEPLLADDMFPPMVGHMSRIGEETGMIEDMLTKLADYYDEEVEMATQTVMAAVEPLIIIALAGVVIVIIGAVLSPMITMYGGMDNL